MTHNRSHRVKNVFSNILPGLTLGIVFFLFLPTFVYLFNLNSVDTSKWTILKVGFLMALLTGLLLTFATFLPKIGRVINKISGILASAIFIFIVFPFHTGEISGFGTFLASESNVWIWIKFLGIIFGIVILTWKYPKGAKFFYKVVLVISLGTIGYMVLLTQSTFDGAPSAKTEEIDYACQLGSKENIIVIVLDSFTGQVADQVFKDRPALKNKFKGFTIYPLAIASALNTPVGISAILSGDLRFALGAKNHSELGRQTIRNSFLMDAKKKGFIPKYFGMPFLRIAKKFFRSYNSCNKKTFYGKNIESYKNPIHKYCTFLSITLSRIFPTQLYQFVIPAFQSTIKTITPIFDQQKAFNHNQEFQALKSAPPTVAWGIISKINWERFIEKISIGADERVILYYYSKMTHSKWVITESGDINPTLKKGHIETSRYTLNSLATFFDKLTRLKIYDKSLIIITADHGAMPYTDKTYGGLLQKTDGPPPNESFNPIFMVKPPKYTHRLRHSNMTVWLGDIAATIRDFLKTKQNKPQMFKTISLFNSENKDRKVNLPIFLKPKQVDYWTPLSKWVRIDFNGSFLELGTKIKDKINLTERLKTQSELIFYAGINYLSTELRKKYYGMKDSYVCYSGILSVDRIPLVELNKQGIVICEKQKAMCKTKKFYLTNISRAIQYLQKKDNSKTLFVIGVQIPKKTIKKIANELNIQRKIEIDGKLLNFIFWNGISSKNSPIFKISNKDIEFKYNWNPPDK
jgi:hypothetical protein